MERMTSLEGGTSSEKTERCDATIVRKHKLTFLAVVGDRTRQVCLHTLSIICDSLFVQECNIMTHMCTNKSAAGRQAVQARLTMPGVLHVYVYLPAVQHQKISIRHLLTAWSCWSCILAVHTAPYGVDGVRTDEQD